MDSAVVSLAHLKKNIDQIEDSTNVHKIEADVKNENVSESDAAVIPRNREVSQLKGLHHQRESSPHPEKLNGNYKRGEFLIFLLFGFEIRVCM